MMSLPQLLLFLACLPGQRYRKAQSFKQGKRSWSMAQLEYQVAWRFRLPNILEPKKSLRQAVTPTALKSLATLGADVTIPLTQDEETLEKAFLEPFHEGVDVVLDYLWGPSMERLLIAAAKAGADGVPIRFIQIGAASAYNISLPNPVLRSSAIQLMGSGIGSVPFNRLLKAIESVLQASIPGGFEIATTTVPLSEVTTAWSTETSQARTVFLV